MVSGRVVGTRQTSPAVVLLAAVLLAGCGGRGGADDGDLRSVLDPLSVGTEAPESTAPPSDGQGSGGSIADTPTEAVSPADGTALPSPPAAEPAGEPWERDASIAGLGYGIQIHGCGYEAEPALDLVVEAGFHWVKQQVRWEEVEGEGFLTPDWRCLDEVVDAAAERNLKVLLSITTSPQWSRPGSTEGPPDVLPLFGQFCLRVADRYTGRIHAIEVFNEPNLDREWGEHLNPAAYVTLLEWAYYGIKGKDKDIVVIGAALAPTQWNDWATAVDDRVYLQHLGEAGAGSFMDCLGTHFNHGTGSPLAEGGEFERQMQDYHDAFGGELPLCVTEFGFATPDRTGGRLPKGFAWAAETSAAEQAEWLVDGFEWAAAHPDVIDLMIVWNLNYHADDTDDPNVPFALWSPRGLMPAYYSLAEMDKPLQALQ